MNEEQTNKELADAIKAKASEIKDLISSGPDGSCCFLVAKGPKNEAGNDKLVCIQGRGESIIKTLAAAMIDNHEIRIMFQTAFLVARLVEKSNEKPSEL